MSDTTNGQKVNEETFHEIIEANPRVIPFFEGKEFLGHEFRVGKKYIDFVLKDSTYYYLVEMKYQQDPIAAIIDLDKKAPLFAKQESLSVEQIKEVILVDRQSYKDKKQELKYHKDKGVICLIYDSAELLGGKGLSFKKQALKRYEMYYLKPLKKIQEEISQIKSGSVYLGPKRRYSKPKSYFNFLTSHMENINDIASALGRQYPGSVNLGDISSVKEKFSPIISTTRELVKEYRVIARCEPLQGFSRSHTYLLDNISSIIEEFVDAAIQWFSSAEQTLRDVKDEDAKDVKFSFKIGKSGDAERFINENTGEVTNFKGDAEEFSKVFKNYFIKVFKFEQEQAKQQALGCSSFICLD